MSIRPVFGVQSVRFRLHLGWATLTAVLGGVLAVLAFPTFGVWPAAFASVAALNLAMYGQRARVGALLGFVYGLAFFVPLLHWTGIYVGAAPWLLLAVTEAVYLAVMGAALPAVLRLPGGVLFSALLFVLQEAVRSRWPFGGFPWARLGFSQPDSVLRWFAVVGGIPLVSFAVALVGAIVARLIIVAVARQWRPALLPALLLIGIVGLALLIPHAALPGTGTPDGTATIAVIQGSTPDRGLEFNARRRQVLDNHVQQTLALADDIDAGRVPRPQIVFWPENSSDIDPLQNTDARAAIQEAADAVGVPILVGAVLDGPGPDHVSNVGMLWMPLTGPAETYTKRHPVPFAEYIPLRSVAHAISSDVDLVPRDMIAGTGDGLMRSGPFPFGDVICFEVAYDSLVRSSVEDGAQMVVVQTNNATFGHTAEAYQQLEMSRMRAIETQRSVVQVSTTGVSAVIDRDGRVVDRSGALYTPARLVQTIDLSSARTLSTRLGSAPEWLLCAGAIAGIGWAVGITVARRRHGGSAPAGQETGDDEVPGPAIGDDDQTGDQGLVIRAGSD